MKPNGDRIIVPNRDIVHPGMKAMSFLNPGKNIHRGWNWLLGGDDGGVDIDVISQVQNALLVDQSTFAHTVSYFPVTPGTTVVAAPGFPSGQGRVIADAHNGYGVRLNAPPINAEWTFGALPVCFECFVILGTNATSGGSQILYNDNTGFNGNLFFIGSNLSQVRRPALRLNGFTDVVTPVTVPQLTDNVAWFVAAQIYADREIYFWAGLVSGGVASGGVSLTAAPGLLDAPTAGPYIGYVGGSGGINNYIYDQHRVSVSQVYAKGPTITIPSSLFPIPS